jgi:hypothetical protein
VYARWDLTVGCSRRVEARCWLRASGFAMSFQDPLEVEVTKYCVARMVPDQGRQGY